VLTLTISTPPGTEVGDVMIASIAIRPNSAVTPPSGWNLVRRTENPGGSPNSLVVYWRLATASEPDGHSWVLGSSTGSAGGILAFRGVDAFAPIDVENGQATPDSLSHATPSVETTVADTMVVTAHAYASGGTWTPPAGMTEGFDVRSQAAFGGGGITICGNWSRQAAAGATGARTAVASSSQDTGNTHILALRPAP
jgi:MSHA biogenesis protein MshQ